MDFPQNKWYPKKGLEMFVRKRIWCREKGKMEVKKDVKKLIARVMHTLDAFEKDMAAEAADKELISLTAATW